MNCGGFSGDGFLAFLLSKPEFQDESASRLLDQEDKER